MLTYTMDVLPESIWLRTTPGASAMGQPYVCTEAGQYLAQGHFSTARTHKESYLLFYTLRGAGLIEQGDDRVLLRAGQALLMDCRKPQRYATAPVSTAGTTIGCIWTAQAWQQWRNGLFRRES